jgi:TetR/AcrR family transcriptional repressor of nem operon
VARPREFDENEVLDRALETFWSKGFDGTSIQDLIASTGLARASLYGTFGDKQQLYERVLEHYASQNGGRMMVAVDAEAPLRKALEQLLVGWVGLTCPKAGPRGCFLVLAGTQGNDNAFAREALASSLKRMEKVLADVLRRGQERRELAADCDVSTLARLLVVLVQGIAICARAGWGQDRLRSVVEEMLDLAIPK